MALYFFGLYLFGLAVGIAVGISIGRSQAQSVMQAEEQWKAEQRPTGEG